MGEINYIVERLSSDQTLSRSFEADPLKVCAELGVSITEKAGRIIKNMDIEKRRPRYVRRLFVDAFNDQLNHRDRLFAAYQGVLVSQFSDCLLVAEESRRKLAVKKTLKTSPMFTLIPALVIGNSLSRDIVSKITVVFSAMCDAGLDMDRLIDGDADSSKFFPLDVFTRLNQFQELLIAFQVAHGVNLHKNWVSRFSDFIRGATLEKEMVEESFNQNINMEFHQELAYLKHAVLFFGIDIVEPLIDINKTQLESAMRYYFSGVQLFDDLRDLAEDKAAGRISYAMSTLASTHTEEYEATLEALNMQTRTYFKLAANTCPKELSTLKDHLEMVSRITNA